MREKGVRFQLGLGRQAFRVDGKFKFWGGATIAVASGGPGLVDSLYTAAEERGVAVRYDAWVRELVLDENGIRGVVVTGSDRKSEKVFAPAVVLACGGFEANAAWRAKYLGPGWDLAKVRGTRFNTGDGLAMAIAAGAQPHGHWSGCHAVSWERNAEEFGELALTPQYQRHSYPFCIMVNRDGRRFIDEGADFRNYTYAKYGQAVLEQPGQLAWQIFDSKVTHLLRDEYRTRHVSKVTANSLDELAAKLDEIDGPQLLKTIEEFNASVKTSVPFDPNVKDGRSASSGGISRTNWANTIDTPPFEAYAVTCGITFTFGGVKVSTEAEVLDAAGSSIPGLFAAGEIVGGLFYFNYPGATGLTSGSVFGRVAGKSAAAFQAKARREATRASAA
jgi:tricarballylate dehydrogenase